MFFSGVIVNVFKLKLLFGRRSTQRKLKKEEEALMSPESVKNLGLLKKTWCFKSGID